MKLTFAVPLVVIFCTHFSALAQNPTESEQDRIHVNCLAERRVDPANISREDSVFCLSKAGIQDPGEAARAEKGLAWRHCLVNQAARWDDGVSPVSDIARTVIAPCAQQWRGYVDSMWLNHAAKREMAEGLEKYGVEEGARAVLLVRKTAREKNK